MSLHPVTGAGEGKDTFQPLKTFCSLGKRRNHQKTGNRTISKPKARLTSFPPHRKMNPKIKLAECNLASLQSMQREI
jgi:hypothetical protein